jgi:hypothetical protein
LERFLPHDKAGLRAKRGYTKAGYSGPLPNSRHQLGEATARPRTWRSAPVKQRTAHCDAATSASVSCGSGICLAVLGDDHHLRPVGAESGEVARLQLVVGKPAAHREANEPERGSAHERNFPLSRH